MYLDEYENRGYPIKGFLIKSLIIIVFFLLIALLLSKNIFKEKSNNKEKVDKSIYETIEKIENSVIKYYNADRLPKTVNETDTITLKNMIDNGIITINQNNIDINKSYASITKLEDDYLLKVLVNKNDKEQYTLSKLNSYSYCETYLCKKEDINYSNYSGIKPVVPFSKDEINKPIEPAHEAVINPECKKINNKYYDQNGKRVSEVDYIIKCQNPKCEMVEGYYFGKKGTSVTKTKYIKECESLFRCIEFDDNYYDSKGSKVSKQLYEQDCNTKGYKYEYIKKTDITFSDWSDWSEFTKTDCKTEEVNCDNNSKDCLFKLQKLVKKEKTGIYQKTYETKRKVLIKTGSFKKKSCSNYNYIKIDGKLYATPSKSNYETFKSLDKDTINNDWIYIGEESIKELNELNINNYYKFIKGDFTYCVDTCTNNPSFIYDSFKYIGGIAEVESTTTTSNIDGILLSEIYEEEQSNKFSSKCGSFKNKEISIYKTKTIKEKDVREEPLYGDVCYKSTKERKVIGAGSTKTIWSKMNDESLLKDGWIMTGKVK